MIGMEESRRMVRERADSENLRKHMHAVSAIMRELAERLGKDREEWEKVGLLHDIDYGETKDNPAKHGLMSAEMLEGDLPEECLRAIKSHNFEHTNVEPESDLDNALIAADSISGLAVATALVMPNKKIKEVRVESIIKKFDDSSFAKSVDRGRIMYCEELGLDREEFVSISLEALKKINEELGL